MTLRVSLSARGRQFRSTEEQQTLASLRPGGQRQRSLRCLQPALNNCHPAREILVLRGEQP